ncbi:hypothetical protein [Pontibacter arcticus]|nr:hypothetical protein [Pontibacter arcticus]
MGKTHGGDMILLFLLRGMMDVMKMYSSNCGNWRGRQKKSAMYERGVH